MNAVAWLVFAVPALMAVLALLFGRRLPGGPAALTLLGTAVATVVAIGLLPGALDHPARTVVHSYAYTPTGGVALHVGTSVSGLSAVLSVMVCVVSLLVQIYSIGYLHGDLRLPSYFAWVSLFTAAMLLVVLASDLFELYAGWEVMGICSYLLVGHYRESRGAGLAAIKAFLVTRLGDVAFLFGIFTLGTAAHSFAIADVTRVAGLPHGTVVAGTLLLLGGVAGKSAQFPLQTWLPDAMAGPTPVSALIHAATMVAAGVFVVARLYPDFAASPVTMTVLALAAVATMLLSALAALVQDDLKRVLAWSTVSQLAYMTAGLAVGGYQPALFHLLNHAAFKALLFLAAGAVLHAVGTNLMSEMGGLWRRMPLTFVTFLVGAFALAGVPPFSGAFSKDAILDAARHVASGDHAATGIAAWVGTLVYAAGLATVVLTALYTTRMVCRTFLGPRHDDASLDETSLAMAVPLVVLALPAAGLGVLALHRLLPTWLPSPVAGTFGIEVAWGPLLLTLGLVLVSVAAVLFLVRAKPDRDPAFVLAAPLRSAMAAGLGVDAAYRSFVVRPVMALGRGLMAFDTEVVDGTVNASGRTARWAGGVVKLSQSGNVQAYATVMLLGVVVIAIVVAVPVSWQQVFLVGLLVVPAIGALAAVLGPRDRAVPVGIAASGVTFVGVLTLLLAWFHGTISGSLLYGGKVVGTYTATSVNSRYIGFASYVPIPKDGHVTLAARSAYTVDVSWLHSIGVRFHLAVDGISLPLLVLTALLTFLCLVYTAKHPPEAGRLPALVGLVLLLEVGMLGTFLAADLIVFFVFFEMVLVPMYFLIGIWGGSDRKQYAATKFILYTLLGSAFMLLGFLGIGLAHHSFDFSVLGTGGLSHRAQDLVFLALLVGFGIKAPMWPLHTWLPDAHTEAPTIGSVLLAGVLLKMGTYGLIRIALPALPLAAHDFAPYLGVLAAIGIVYGSLVCLAQRSLKRLIAFSSVGHMGFVLLGISTLTTVGINGALIGNVAHGLITGLLFFLVGSLKDRYHTDVIDEIGGGAQAKLPYLGGLLGFTAIASLGLPGLAGFWGEMLSLLGAYHPAAGLNRGLYLGLMTAGGLGAVLTASYLLWMLARVNQGVVPPRWRDVRIPDVGLVELAVWAPLVVLTVAIGVWPKLVLGISSGAVSALTGGLR